ncbi:MAG: hypothetical protein Q8P20_08745 [bacterium]|nr:hypothetical protein [bacterium]
MVKKITSLSIEEKTIEKYKNFCDKYGYNFSKRVELLILKDMEGEKL